MIVVRRVAADPIAPGTPVCARAARPLKDGSHLIFEYGAFGLIEEAYMVRVVNGRIVGVLDHQAYDD